jgi:lipoprotein-anchoring transpeptidase ErfK/SrfK
MRRGLPHAWPAGIAAAVAAGTLLLTGCSPGHILSHGNNRPAASASTHASSVTFTNPGDGATGVSTAVELTVRTQRVGNPTVTVTDSAGNAVPGGMRADGSAWVPASQLAYATGYTATVTAAGAQGRAVSAVSHFTTADKPAMTMGARTPLARDQVVGVGAPLVITFPHAIAADRRAAVEQRLFVTATPAQPGSWYWFSGTEVHYRPRTYWQPGTQISIRAALGGLDLGNGYVGSADMTQTVSVTDHPLAITIDDTTKTLTVTRDGVVVRTMPVSLGKDSTPSSSGHMVVMSRETEAIFDSSTYGVPVDSAQGYRETVYYPLRLTWGGQYIHAAPWSVDAQGTTDVSHGCTNISTENARWLYTQTHVGDPVTVQHTSGSLKWGDGWSDWDRDWTAYRQGSALDHTVEHDYSAPSTS